MSKLQLQASVLLYATTNA